MKKLLYLYFCIAVLLSAGLLGAENAKKPRVQVVFVLDTTGSMSGLIQAAKDKIWAIASTLATAKPAPDISMGLVGYRDRGDEYITKFTSLSFDIDKVYADLMSYAAGGGGDGEESVNQALNEAVTKLEWDKDPETYRVIFLVGDWPPHMDYSNDVKYQETCRSAKEKGIIINTIQMGPLAQTIPVWKEIASLTNGQYFMIDGSMVHTHYDTPFDKDIAELAEKYDDTRVYYGDAEAKKESEARERTGDAVKSGSADSVVAQRMAYNLSEAGKSNFLGGNELIDRVANGEVKLSDIKTEELPPAMQSMTQAERGKYVADRIAERKK
ncbi:MAG: VWA domain-containing protein, partial [Spirochaetaceae bacterium]